MSIATESGCKHRGYGLTKNSNVEWLGEVPQHWDILRLKYSADLVNEKVNGADSELPYTGLEHIESWSGSRVGANVETTSDGQASRHRAGDVLFGKLRPYLAKAYAAESDGICTSELLVFRPKVLLQRFLRNYLLNPSFISIVDSSTYGAKMPRASWDFIGDLPALVPPDDEQRIIVRFLDRETARIDALIERRQRQIELLHGKRAALISHAVTKGLDPDVPTKDSGVEWLGNIPNHWDVMALKMTARKGSRTFSDGDWIEAPFIEDEGIRLIQTGNVGIGEYREQGFRYIGEETFHSLGCSEVFPSDVLICRLDGPVGRACLAPNLNRRMITSVDNAILRPASCHDARFLVYFMSSGQWLDWIGAICRVGGGFRLRISRSMLGDLRVAIPPLHEQKLIADFLDNKKHDIDQVMAKVEASIDRLREYRTALISAAVTGKIDVRQEVA